uniref:Uncharacterized protein n=1 Tax=Caenorhabditis japonica TaxID=281687 RepID=A0A8R1IFQ4_CAEJA
MSTKPIIHFYVDTSFKMHMKTSEGLTAMEKVAKFLLHFCRRNDKQAAYFSRHFGKTLVQLKTGKAEKMLHEYIKNMTKRADILDPITFWKEAVESDTCNSTFFVLTTCVDAKTLNLLFPFRNSLFFMDFGGKPNLSFKDRVKFVKISDIQKDADDIHEMHLQDYLTRVNFGVPFHAEFHTVNAKDKRQISFSDIKIVATTLSGPLEGTTVLASSLLFPVNNCYHVAKGELEKSRKNMGKLL